MSASDADTIINMKFDELKASGILELYALGQASPEEVKLVEDMLSSHPELKHELQAISDALEVYGRSVAVNPSPGLKDALMNEIVSDNSKTDSENNNNQSNGNSPFNFLSIILALATAGLLFMFFNQKKAYSALNDDYNTQVARCDSIEASLLPGADLYAQLNASESRIINLNPTDNYPETQLTFFNNPSSGRNFIQLANLPSIDGTTQSFQLWSLKGDQAIPLDVFQGNEGNIFEVQFEPDSDAYAITIEPIGGRETPTLENLIGVIPIG